ncbi:MAG: PEP-CTERM sorting domain-containing protein [Planctomycetota bacterium]
MRSTYVLLGVAAATMASGASADPIFDTFGPLPQATFGGTGIPNDEVAAGTQFVDGQNTITIALSATQRFSNPALGNDGAGTYFATPGSNFGGNAESTTEGSRWNFNFYISIEAPSGSSPRLADYQIDLFYDFDTGADTAIGDLGRINVTNSILVSSDPNATVTQGSQNLLFGFLGTSIPNLLDAPAGSFDPNALGEYSFALTVSQIGGLPLETVAIDVDVVPAPASAALLAAGGLAMARRRRR